MTHESPITFVSHTNKPGGGELALRRYLQGTDLPVRLVTLEDGGVWEGLEREVVHARGMRGLRRALREGGLVVANSMRAAFLTALVAPRSTRLVYWVRDGLTDSAMSWFALTLTKQVTARRTAHYLANSEWTATTVRSSLGVGNSQVRVVQSMCGVSARDTVVARPSPRSPVRLLFLGRLAPWKAPDLAVRAVALLRARGIDVMLSIAGEAHFGEDDYVAKLGELPTTVDGVTVIGHVEDVPAILRSHDVTVHCSRHPEPFGQVIVQSLAAGVPVVATDGGGPSEILGGAPIRLTYLPPIPEALADAVERVLVSYATISQWAVQHAKGYSDEKAAHDTDAALNSFLCSPLINKRPRTP